MESVLKDRFCSVFARFAILNHLLSTPPKSKRPKGVPDCVVGGTHSRKCSAVMKELVAEGCDSEFILHSCWLLAHPTKPSLPYKPNVACLQQAERFITRAFEHPIFNPKRLPASNEAGLFLQSQLLA